METNRAQDIISRTADLASSRGVFESHWQEIAERIYPQYSNTFGGNLNTPGGKINSKIHDSTAVLGLSRSAAIMDSLLTPRNQTWHRLKVSNRELAKDRSVILYFDEVNSLLFKYRYAPKANFASQNQKIFKSLCGFGTAGMFVDELYGSPGIRYKSIHLGELYFTENHQGVVNAVYRKFSLTAKQAFEIWGSKLPNEIQKKRVTSPLSPFFFIHCVKERKLYDPSRKDAEGMPYESVYVSVEGQVELSSGGYATFPYAITRYEQSENELYGRSPAMDVLPAVKTLNEEKITVLKQGHRTVDPVLLAHDDGVLDSFSMKPGAMNYGGVTSEGKLLVHTLPVGNIAVGKDLMDDERQVINDAFLITLFQILIETPQMTATEVMERMKEKGILLAPTMGRQQSEYLGPMIEREIDILARQRLLPPMPQILIEAKGEYNIEYDSPLSRAQRAEEASGLMRTVENALSIVNVTQDPAPLDHFNWDIIIPEISSIQGVPARWMNSIDAIKAIREGRSEAGKTQEMIQAAPGAAAMIKSTAIATRGK